MKGKRIQVKFLKASCREERILDGGGALIKTGEKKKRKKERKDSSRCRIMTENKESREIAFPRVFSRMRITWKRQMAHCFYFSMLRQSTFYLGTKPNQRKNICSFFLSGNAIYESFSGFSLKEARQKTVAATFSSATVRQSDRRTTRKPETRNPMRDLRTGF